MGNEEQQPPLPQQGAAGQQGYYGWQYDQDQERTEVPLVPLSPSFSPPPQEPPLPTYPPPQERRPLQPPQLPARFQEPVADMGTSLGYGQQGTEYQYFDAPQPSQPMPQMRQERLQQLREERMRRQQRRLGGDVTTILSRRSRGGKQQRPPVNPPAGPQAAPSWGPDAPPSMLNGASAPSPTQMSPAPSLPSQPVGELSPIRASTLPPVGIRPSLDHAPLAKEHMQAAAEPAQDTGMLQRVRIGRATLILTGAFVASRVLGLLRTSMFAFVFGTSKTSDAYLQAFLIPDLIFNIVAGGALSSAFIPVFTKYMVGEAGQKDERSAWHVASSALNLAIAIMMGLAFIAMIFAPVIVPFYNSAAISDPTQLNLIISLTRIMLLQSIALGAGVIINAVLNARQNFLLPALGTVIYNVGLIAGLVPGIYFAFHGHRDDMTAVYAATWGVVLGALLQVGIQIPGLFKVRMHYTPSFDWRHPGVVQIGRQMVPRIINAAMLYLSIFVDRGLIQLLSSSAGKDGIDGLITQYYQALQLVLLPLSIFGMAVSTAAFPTLAENVAKGRLDRVRGTILETLRSILFMSIPSSVGLIVLGLPIIQVLLEHGRFSLSMAQSTAVPLAFFAFGLAGLAAVEILTRSFYAQRDSTTPVIVSVGQFIFKIALSLILIDVSIWGAQWGMGALAFSTSVAALLEAVVLFWLLHQRIGELQVRQIGLFIGRVVLASAAMGVGLFITSHVLDFLLGTLANIPALIWLDTIRTPSLGLPGTIVAVVKLLIELFVGAFIYIRGARMLGIEELGPVKRVLDRLKLSWI